MIHFAVTDRQPLPGGAKVRYFVAPDCAISSKVAERVLSLVNVPRSLTFIERPEQLPLDDRLTVLTPAEVC
jgi:hypothetical protein